MYTKSNHLFMFKVSSTLFILLLVIIPVLAIDTDKWDLVTHQEIVPKQSFPVGEYTITMAEREKNDLNDYTVVIFIEKDGIRQTELMRVGDTALFDDDHYQLEYVGTQDDKQVFNVYHEKGYPNGGGVEVPQNVSETVTSESVNTSAQSEPTIPFDSSNLMAIGALILLVVVRKR
jgi:sorbitol-specific phosphotransferase system component IIA